MHIPQHLEQCNDQPHLLIVAGDYESRFFVAFKGEMIEKERIQFSMREEGKEKQSYRASNPSPQKTGAVSHYGKYHQDLKEKFHKSVQENVRGIAEKEHVKKIILFAPKQSIQKIYDQLHKNDQEKVQEQIKGIYTKKDPVAVLEIWKEQKNKALGPIYLSEEEEKIIKRPTTN